MNREAIQERAQNLIAALDEAQAYAKDKKMPAAFRTRLRALRLQAASICYLAQENAPEGFWTRLKRYFRGEA